MNSKTLAGAVAVAVWYVIWDLFLFGPIFGSFLSGVEGMVAEPALLWIVVGNLAAGLVLAWFYGKVGSAFGNGVKGGLNFGVAVGIVMGFPMWLFQSVYFTGWPYSAAWAMVVANIVWVAVAGVVLALVSSKMASGGDATT
jgi:hypothetical protein